MFLVSSTIPMSFSVELTESMVTISAILHAHAFETAILEFALIDDLFGNGSPVCSAVEGIGH